MTITKKRQHLISNYSLDNSLQEEVKELKDLGITTTDIIVSKANRMLGLIKTTCRGLDDTKTLRTLYCTLVRLNVEYYSVVWSPYTKKNMDKVEKVQKRLKTEDNYENYFVQLHGVDLTVFFGHLLTFSKRRVHYTSRSASCNWRFFFKLVHFD